MHDSAAWNLLRHGTEAVLAVLFPPHCGLCGGFAPRIEHHSICSGCWKTVVPLKPPLCGQCGLPLDSAAAFEGVAAPLCGPCTIEAPPFRLARAYTPYQGVVRELVHLLKFSRRQDLAIPMGKWLAEAYAHSAELAGCDAILPVPLHPRRKRSRGFNQAELLARTLSRSIGLQVWPHILVRSKDTLPQSGLTDAQREQNIRGAFSVHRSSKIAGRKLLLVDDVYTTGATLAACCRALLDAGAGQVCVLTVARVPHHH